MNVWHHKKFIQGARREQDFLNYASSRRFRLLGLTALVSSLDTVVVSHWLKPFQSDYNPYCIAINLFKCKKLDLAWGKAWNDRRPVTSANNLKIALKSNVFWFEIYIKLLRLRTYNFWFSSKCKRGVIFGIETRHFMKSWRNFWRCLWRFWSKDMTQHKHWQEPMTHWGDDRNCLFCLLVWEGSKNSPETFANLLYKRLSLGGRFSGIVLLSLCCFDLSES